MIITQKNAGQKIDYSQNGYLISFGGAELTLNAQSYQRDENVHLNICYDDNRNLVIGTASGKEYVAELDIPAREYNYPETVQSMGDEDDGEMAEQPAPTPVPLDMDAVTLTLWAINEEGQNNG